MMKTEIAVIGAGPAGLSAACAAREAGAEVLVLDDQPSAGGQLFKQVHKFFGSEAHLAGIRGIQIGRELLDRARSIGVEIRLSAPVIGIFPGLTLGVVHDQRMDELEAGKIILATGATERTLAFPGWTLPGVMGAGAAQTLMNIHRVLPGKRVLMVGSGNVGLIVAYQLLQAGAEVAAIVEAAPVIGGYWVHAAKVRRAGVPILTSHTVQEVRGREQVEEAVIVELDKSWNPIEGTQRTVAVDAICLAVGLWPSTQLTMMAGCEHRWDALRGGHVPTHTESFETSVPGLYVAGDLAGIEEASTAMEQGRIAGLSAAHAMGYLSEEEFGRLCGEGRDRLTSLRLVHPSFSEEGQTPIIGRGGVLTANAVRTGALEVSDLQALPGVPSGERLRRGGVAVIECPETIPCNVCEPSCARGTVRLEGSLTALPRLDGERCNGCAQCVASCPGQAVFVVNTAYASGEASVAFPWEFLPLPQVGASVHGTDRTGKPVVAARVVKVDRRARLDHTAVVTVAVPVEYAQVVRGIARK